ncbi:succinate--CoA ligase subunit alpha, partial [candidate division TA06 bacterium]
AGGTPGKGGQDVDGIPVFDTVKEAVEKTGANTAISFVPARFAVEAIYEAGDSGVKLIVCITEGIPALEMVGLLSFLSEKGVRLIGPNCPGLVSPEKCKVGILPTQVFKQGPVGVVSRSGTLTYEVVSHITNAGYGQSTCLGIGGDAIIGTRFIDCLKLFEEDPQTEAVVLVGEIGGTDEEDASEYIKAHVKKPVIAFIAGLTAPPGKRMGHAGAIISGGSGTAKEKIAAFEKAGVQVATEPEQIGQLVKARLK